MLSANRSATAIVERLCLLVEWYRGVRDQESVESVDAAAAVDDVTEPGGNSPLMSPGRD
jgi:hypothetical protein